MESKDVDNYHWMEEWTKGVVMWFWWASWRHTTTLTTGRVKADRDAAVRFRTQVRTWTFQNRTKVRSKVRVMGRTGLQVRFWVRAKFKTSEPCWTWFEPNFFVCLFCIFCDLKGNIFLCLNQVQPWANEMNMDCSQLCLYCLSMYCSLCIVVALVWLSYIFLQPLHISAIKGC